MITAADGILRHRRVSLLFVNVFNLILPACTMPSIILFGGQHLRKIEFRQHGIRKMSGHMIETMPKSKLSLEYSDNGFTCLSPDAFNISRTFGSRVTQLDLPGNSLAGQIQSDLIFMAKQCRRLTIKSSNQ